jgi:hypothetical protein
MPNGKAAGQYCVQLDENMRCKIFGHPDRPPVCGSLQPDTAMCGDSREQALRWLGYVEKVTAPNPP